MQRATNLSSKHNKVQQSDEALRCTPFDIETTRIKLTIDLDAVITTLPIKEFASTFKLGLNLDLKKKYDPKKSPSIRARHTLKSDDSLHLNKLPHMKLGISSSPLGTLNLYLMSKKDVPSSAFYLTTFNYFKDYICNNKSEIATKNFIKINKDADSISGNMIISDVEKIVLANDEDMYIHAECFGCKAEATFSEANIDMLLNKLGLIFDMKILKDVLVDICISVWCGPSTVSIACLNLFDILGLVPNYTTLLSRLLINYNGKAPSSKTQSALKDLGDCKIIKFNLYSNYKSFLSNMILDQSLFTYANYLFFNNIYDIRKNLNKKIFTSIDNTFDIKRFLDQKVIDECSYRLEVRTTPEYFVTFFNFLKDNNFKRYFKALDFKSFFVILNKNLENFKNCLLGTFTDIITPSQIVKTFICEKYLREVYIAGRKTIKGNYIVGSVLHDKEKLLTENFEIVDLSNLIKIASDNISKAEIIKILEYIVNRNKNISNIKKTLYCIVLRLINEIDNIDIPSEILKIVSQEQSQNLDANISLFYNNNSSELATLNFDAWINKFFRSKRLTAARLLYLALLSNNRCSHETFTAILQKYFINNKFNIVFANKNANGELIQYNLEIITNSREMDLLRLNLEGLNAMPGLKRIKCDREEAIRLMNAFLYYKDESIRLKKIHNDLSYGFFKVRSVEWIKQKSATLKTFFLSYDSFCITINDIKTWNPCLFIIPSRISYLSSLGLNLNNYQAESYAKLLKHYTLVWNESLFKSNVLNLKASDIISTVFGPSPRYDTQFLYNINVWCQNYDNSNIIPNKANIECELTKFYTFDYNLLITKIEEEKHTDLKIESEESPVTIIKNPLKVVPDAIVPSVEVSLTPKNNTKKQKFENFNYEFKNPDEFFKDFCLGLYSYNIIRSKFSKALSMTLFEGLRSIFKESKFLPFTLPKECITRFIDKNDINLMFRMLTFFGCLKEVRYNIYLFNIEVESEQFITKDEIKDLILKYFNDETFTISMISKRLNSSKRCSTFLMRMLLLSLTNEKFLGIIVTTGLDLNTFILIK